MSALFLLLWLACLIALVVGLIKPQTFSRYINNPTRGKAGLIFGGALIITGILFSLSSGQPAQPKPQTIADAPTITKEEPSMQPVGEVKKEPSLEESLQSIAHKTGTTDLSYRSMDVEKSDTNRPSDTKMITVSINVKNFYNRNSLLRDTSEVSSKVLQAVYGKKEVKAYHVFVWYYGESTDQYGNKNDDVVLTYAIDKATYDKLNWSNFDSKSLCSFLEQEARDSGTFNTACNVLVNIK